MDTEQTEEADSDFSADGVDIGALRSTLGRMMREVEVVGRMLEATKEALQEEDNEFEFHDALYEAKLELAHVCDEIDDVLL